MHVIDSIRQINQEHALGKGGVVSSILTGGTSNPTENQRFSGSARSPSVRQYAEQRANMRGLVRRDCGRIPREGTGMSDTVSLPAVARCKFSGAQWGNLGSTPLMSDNSPPQGEGRGPAVHNLPPRGCVR